MEIRVLQPGDEDVLRRVAPDVFDDPLNPRATREFLHDPRHHIVVAIDADVVVGFATAVHYVHPDKPSPELWINEVGVAPTHHQRGIGKALLEGLLDRARALGCREAWVLTERGNQPAMRLYQAAGGVEAGTGEVMFNFAL
jgi:GNAT superfamily N-acetyltransferase